MNINPEKHLLRILSLLVFIGIGILPATAAGYQVRFKIKGIKDTTVMIGNYYGNGTYIKDTLKVDGSGRFTWKAPEDLPRGIYLVVITDKNYFEFIADKDTRFSMETDVKNPVENMVITDSPDNKLFYEYLMYNREKYKQIKELEDHQVKVKENKDSLKIINDKINGLNSEIIKYKLSLVEKHPASFVAFFINAMKEPEIPEIPVLANGKKDSTFAYRYYKAHFWDGTVFTDDRLLRTPVFHSKLMKYFDKVVLNPFLNPIASVFQAPDSVIKESDRLIELARPNPEMFKYLIWFTTWHYENSEIMGMDKVFVHVVETYYVTNQTPWVNSTVKENVIKKAQRIKPLLLGSVPPNMIMLDTSNQLVSMYDIKSKYLILLFWDPDCGHCEQEIPKLKSFYDESKTQYGLQIMTICSDTSLVKWKNALKKRNMNFINVDGPRSLTGNYHDQYDIQTTPVIYILDERKTILAKNLKTDQIGMFLKNYEELKQKK
ncbi:MAG: thioredoxin-like domain-containing protein [Syntrophothermus sp.]